MPKGSPGQLCRLAPCPCSDLSISRPGLARRLAVSRKQDRCQEFVNVNRNAVWKYLVLAVVGLVAALYALPNLFGEDPAVQVSGVRGVEVDTVLEQRLTSRLALAELQPKKVELDAGRLLMRFDSTEQQSAARDVIHQELGREYVVALNLASAAPDWLSALNASPM